MAAAQEPPDPDSPAGKAPSKLFSEEDGWLDMSGFLDTAYGFVPILFPITEPAVGYGGGLGLLFIDKPQGNVEAPSGFGRPNMTVVGGLATANGTWGAFAGDVRQWHADRVQTVVGAIAASVNLDFYGIGDDAALEDDPLRYTLEPLGGAFRVRYRLSARSRTWVGAAYALVDTDISVDESSPAVALPEESRVGGLIPSLAYDSRNNIFTPTRGTYFEGTAGFFDEAFGGDDSFQRVGLTYIYYRPLGDDLNLGVRGGSTLSFGDVPFYMLPYVVLRGAPAMRYQGDKEAEAEVEARWQFWKRFSLVGFVGGGVAWTDSDRDTGNSSVVTGGAGFRYELARKYGLHAGLDVAYGPDGPVLYVQFGSAWARP